MVTRARPQPTPVSVWDRLIRQDWERLARAQDLRPAAAWWRWHALMSGHMVYWLKQPLEEPSRE